MGFDGDGLQESNLAELSDLLIRAKSIADSLGDEELISHIRGALMRTGRLLAAQMSERSTFDIEH